MPLPLYSDEWQARPVVDDAVSERLTGGSAVVAASAEGASAAAAVRATAVTSRCIPPERVHATEIWVTCDLAVDEPAIRSASGFQDRLGERRMGVDRACKLGIAALELLGDDQFLDQVGGLRGDDVAAENLAVLLVADDLDHSATVAVDRRGTDRAHRDLPDGHVVALLLGRLLGQAEARHLRRAEGRCRDRVVVQRCGSWPAIASTAI